MFRQGIKSSSIITNENVQAIFMVHLRGMEDENRTPEILMRDCSNDLFKKIPNAPNSITARTAARSIKFLSFHPKLQREGYTPTGTIERT